MAAREVNFCFKKRETMYSITITLGEERRRRRKQTEEKSQSQQRREARAHIDRSHASGTIKFWQSIDKFWYVI